MSAIMMVSLLACAATSATWLKNFAAPGSPLAVPEPAAAATLSTVVPAMIVTWMVQTRVQPLALASSDLVLSLVLVFLLVPPSFHPPPLLVSHPGHNKVAVLLVLLVLQARMAEEVQMVHLALAAVMQTLLLMYVLTCSMPLHPAMLMYYL
jgi:hypothetical protein